MAISAELFRSIAVCAFFLSAHVSAVSLKHKYPLSRNYSRVQLHCQVGDDFNPKVLEDAVFFLGEREITNHTVVGYSRNGGLLNYTITPEGEGPLSCSRPTDRRKSSEVLKLAGINYFTLYI